MSFLLFFRHFFSFIIISFLLPSFLLFYRNFFSFIVISSLLPSFLLFYRHFFSFIVISSLLSSFLLLYYHLFSFILSILFSRSPLAFSLFFFYIPPFLQIFLLGFLAHSLDILLTVKWMEKLQNKRDRMWHAPPPPPINNKHNKACRGGNGVLLQKYSKMVEWVCWEPGRLHMHFYVIPVTATRGWAHRADGWECVWPVSLALDTPCVPWPSRASQQTPRREG